MAETDPEPSRRGPLISLAVILALHAGGLWISDVIRGATAIQDCVMAGRTNCAPIHTQAKDRPRLPHFGQ